MWSGKEGLKYSKPHEWERSLNALDVEFLCAKNADQGLEKMTDRHLKSRVCLAHQKQTSLRSDLITVCKSLHKNAKY